MKNKWQRSVFFLFVLSFILVLFPVRTNAATSGSCGVSARWYVSGNVLYINGTGAMYDYEADTAPWADLITSGSSSGGYITGIVINSGITSIGDYAFYGAPYIKTISIGSGVTEIGKYAFSSVEPVSSVTIPDNVTVIDDYAFAFCYDLTQVSLPAKLEKLGVGAFAHCSGLTQIHLPASLTEFGSEDLSSWESGVFSRCTGITAFSVDADNPILRAEDGVLFSKDMTRLYHYPLGSSSTAYTIPEGVSAINSQAFGYSVNLQAVTVSNTVSAIDEYAFYYCSALDEITFCGDAPQINAASIFAGDTLTVWYPFANTTWTADVMQSYGGTVTWSPRGENGEVIGIHGDNVMWMFNAVTGALTIFGSGEMESRFSGSYMPWYSYCEQITSVVVLSGITKIPSYTFEYLENVKTIELPDTLADLALNAFNDCGSLNNLLLPASLTAISGSSNTGYPAFIRCESLTDVYYMGTQEEWLAIPKAEKVTNSYADMQMHFLTLYEQPATCTESGVQTHYAFDDTSVYDYLFDTDRNPVTTLAEIPASGHCFGEYDITPPTFTDEGHQQTTCSVCGETVTETIDKLVGKVDHWNIVLEDDYAVNFYLQISESIKDTAKVRLAVGNDTSTYNVSALEETQDGYFRICANISAAQMNDLIVVMVINGTDVGDLAAYTARQYCDTVLADEAYSNYHPLVKEMLNYGAMAQVYFNYDTDNLANKGITETAAEAVPETAAEMAVSGGIDGVSFYGASLNYRERIAVRYYFTGDVTGSTFTANGNTYTPVTGDVLSFIEIADILPQNLDQQILLTVTNADGDTLTVTYGPMHYIVRMTQKGSDALKDLLKALYNYHLTAKDFKAL